MVCAAKGYPLVVTMAESFSIERRKLMRFLGAKVILTPASEKGSGMIAKARELAEKHGWFLARQFENEAGPDFHSRTTAQEILDCFVARQFGHMRGIAHRGRIAVAERGAIIADGGGAAWVGKGIGRIVARGAALRSSLRQVRVEEERLAERIHAVEPGRGRGHAGDTQPAHTKRKNGGGRKNGGMTHEELSCGPVSGARRCRSDQSGPAPRAVP